jgi:glycyl-tRNA synthetase
MPAACASLRPARAAAAHARGLTEPAEQALDAAYQQAAGQPVGTVDEFFAVLLPMIPAISGFFESVMVMADDPVKRANRLGLLQRLAALAAGLADFSKLEGFSQRRAGWPRPQGGGARM